MRSKQLNSLDECSDSMELFDNAISDCTLLEPDGLELFLPEESEPIESLTDKKVIEKNNADTNVVPISFANPASTTRRPASNIESRMDSALAGLIEQRIQTKALPLALRKRLMYQRSISA